MKIISSPFIEFKTTDEFWDVIPKPYPAGKHMPTWLKNLKTRLTPPPDGVINSTVKRCAPFTEANSLGWIIPLAADVRLTVKETGELQADTMFSHDIITCHGPEQVGGITGPSYPAPPIKFHNYWTIKVPKGYSVLFTPVLNRPNDVFEVFSGLVECDRYWNNVLFPALLKKVPFDGIIEQGTPLVQVIPIPRNSIPKHCKTSIMSKKEFKLLKKVQMRLNAHISHYRDHIWQKGKSKGICPFHKF